jgi:hypothetical protein
MRGMVGTAPDLYEARGVVLIDELETHLHPRWKLRVMAALRAALPQVQFIATTHDPLCLRGMDDGEVHVLIRDEDQRIEQLENLPNVRTLRAEQLLTSDFFGLSSTADPEVEQSLARRADIVEGGASPDSSLTSLDLLVSTRPLGDTPEQQIASDAMKEFLDARPRASATERSEKRRKAVAALRQVIEAGTGTPA